MYFTSKVKSAEIEGVSRNNDSMYAYRCLAVAMIDRAVRDYIQTNMVTQDEMTNLRKWLRSDDITPLSFIWCCELTSLNPQAIRKRIYEKQEIRFKARSSNNTDHNRVETYSSRVKGVVARSCASRTYKGNKAVSHFAL